MTQYLHLACTAKQTATLFGGGGVGGISTWSHEYHESERLYGIF